MRPFALLAPFACFALVACGGAQTPGAMAAHDRHENFEALGKAFKTLGDELKKAEPDIARIQENATAITGKAAELRDWFPVGSGPQDGVKTDALAGVWKEPDAFGRAAAKLVEAATALDAAAQSGNLAAIRGAVPPAGAACKDCHERFRQDD